MFSLHPYFEKVFVIHMDKDKERETHIQRQFANITTNYEFRKGIIPTKEEREKYASPICKHICSPSMLGIYLAHRYIWEEIVTKKIAHAVIFEDDVTFTDDISSVLPKAMQELPLDWELLYLGCITCSDKISPLIKGFMKLKNIHTYDLEPYSSHLRKPCIAIGMEAYAVTYEGAKKLLQLVPYASDHVDIMITQKLDKMKALSVYPSVAYQHPDGFRLSNNNTKTPLLGNHIVSSIDVITLPHTNISLAYVLSIPIAQFQDQMVWNGWSILCMCIGALSQDLSILFGLYLFLEWIYSSYVLQREDTYQYLLYILSLFVGRLIVVVLFRLF